MPITEDQLCQCLTVLPQLKKESKKFETVGKPKLTEEQKAYTLQELKKIKRKKLLNKAKKN